MSKLQNIAGKKYTGTQNNKIISLAETKNDVLNNVLNVTITSTANLDGIIQYKGAIADVDAIKGIRDTEPNIRFILDEIIYTNKSIDLKTIEKEIKTQNQINTQEHQLFKEIKTQDENEITYEGYIQQTNTKTGVKIQKITLETPKTITEFDIASLEDVTKKAFTKLLKSNPKDKTKTIKETNYEPSNKHKSQSVTTGIYDGQIEEDAPIMQKYKTGITRTSSIKSEHIRDGFKKTRLLKAGYIKETAIAPTVIHLNDYTADNLKDACFGPKGEPTQEALILYRGKLQDTDLTALQKTNNFKTMEETYGVMTIGIDYAKMNKLFNPTN
ncbi:MAG: hypothetical protein ACLFN8_03545 [Candidatus Woesearchaeota archaeon]